MMNFDDSFTFGDQFITDKYTEDTPGQANIEHKVESLVSVPVHQASSSAPHLSTPVIDFTTIKQVPFPVQPPTPKCSAWTTLDTREATLSSSKQNTISQSNQPLDDIPTPDEAPLSDPKETGEAHLPKTKPRPDWLRTIAEEDRPEFPEPNWSIPPSNAPEVENNWANAIASSYKDLDENKLLYKTGDMGAFIKWYYQQIGKTKLRKEDLEGPAFKLVRPFHTNSISLQYQMEECHRLLSDKVDLVNPGGGRFTARHRKLSNQALSYRTKMGCLRFPLQRRLHNLYRDTNNQKRMIQETKIYNFSDGRLTRVLEKLDHMVKDF
ncbi:hypothetical protein Tco_1384824 [Tanacetum coccineum]